MARAARRSLYHRWLGWHAPALQRAVTVIGVGVVATPALLLAVPWGLAIILGWDAAAVTFLISAWHLILRADSDDTRRLAGEEDDSRTIGTALLVAVCLAGLLGVGFGLGSARHEAGGHRALLVAVAAITVALSWAMLNTVYTLRYAHLYYGSARGSFSFDDTESRQPNYRDFAYVAFTIGMTYQVSDTTLRSPRTRRTVLVHALLAYLFGVVIIAGAINLSAGLLG